MDMEVILFNGAELFEQIGNTLSTECPHMKSSENCSSSFEKKIFKHYTILYMYIAQGQGQIALRGQKFDFN